MVSGKEVIVKCPDCKKDIVVFVKYGSTKRKSFCPACRAVRAYESELQHREVLDQAVEQRQKIAAAKEEVRRLKNRKEATIDEVIRMAKENGLTYGKMRSLLNKDKSNEELQK